MVSCWSSCTLVLLVFTVCFIEPVKSNPLQNTAQRPLLHLLVYCMQRYSRLAVAVRKLKWWVVSAICFDFCTSLERIHLHMCLHDHRTHSFSLTHAHTHTRTHTHAPTHCILKLSNNKHQSLEGPALTLNLAAPTSQRNSPLSSHIHSNRNSSSSTPKWNQVPLDSFQRQCFY